MGRSADLPRDRRGPDHARPGGDAGCGILHADMDAFYASVEVLDRPELAGRPIVVAGDGPRGVVASASYEARHFGIRSAMPAAIARRRCPDATFRTPRFERYAEISHEIMTILREITPRVEPISLDEAFLDVTGAQRRLGMTPAGIGEWLRAQIDDAQGLTCSVGVATTKYVAKLASSMAKPDGLLVVPADESLAFLHPLPVSALWGAGERTTARLREAGCETIADVAAMPAARLRRLVGSAAAQHLQSLAQGRDERRVVPDAPEKSVGAEETFAIDVADRATLERELLRLADKTATAMRRKGLRARTVAIKVRYPDFTTITRARTLAEATDIGRTVFQTARHLLAAHVPDGQAVRLLGVRADHLLEAGTEQLTLDAEKSGWPDADRAIDEARTRFGAAAVHPASLLGRQHP